MLYCPEVDMIVDEKDLRMNMYSEEFIELILKNNDFDVFCDILDNVINKEEWSISECYEVLEMEREKVELVFNNSPENLFYMYELLQILKNSEKIVKPETYQKVENIIKSIGKDRIVFTEYDKDTERILKLLTNNSVGFYEGKLCFFCSYFSEDKLELCRWYYENVNNDYLKDMFLNADIYGNRVLFLETTLDGNVGLDDIKSILGIETLKKLKRSTIQIGTSSDNNKTYVCLLLTDRKINKDLSLVNGIRNNVCYEVKNG